MTDIVETILSDLKQAHYFDRRLHIFEVVAQVQPDDCLVLTGRVLDQSTLEAMRQAFRERLPGLRVEDQAVRVLRKPNPLVLRVATNLTHLHASPSWLAEMDSQLLYGWPLEILEEQGRWVYTRQNDGYLGWAYRSYLTAEPLPAMTHLVIAPVSGLHATPDRSSPVLTRVLGGSALTVVGNQGEWAEVIANRRGWLPLKRLRGLAALPTTEAEKRTTILDDGLRMIGVPYLWGGCTANGIDCSGLAQLLHRWVGVTIPRDADMQYHSGVAIEPPFAPGDLLFFGDPDNKRRIDHVGISLGGWKLLHSSRAKNGVYVDDVQSVEHLREDFFGACSYLH